MIPLDDDFEQKPQAGIIPPFVKWWEAKRIWYNFAVGLTLLIGFRYRLSSSDLANGDWFWFLLWAIFYLLFANAFYSAGWMVEMLCLYYFKINLGKVYRYTALIIGTAVSILLTATIVAGFF